LNGTSGSGDRENKGNNSRNETTEQSKNKNSLRLIKFRKQNKKKHLLQH